MTNNKSRDNLNTNIAFTLVFAGFLRIREITHIATKLKLKVFH